MIDVIAYPGARIQLGRQGENLHTRICFDVEDIVTQYPEATFVVLNTVPGESSSYPAVNVSRSGDTLYWVVDKSDTSVKGKGECEVVARENNIVVKTEIYKTQVLPSLDGEGEAADGWNGWSQKFLELAEGASNSAEASENSADQSAASATNSATSADQAASKALVAEGYANGQQNGSDVPSGSTYYNNNAKYWREQAEDRAREAEGYALGKQNGSDVGSSSPYYHNNSKYHAEQAAASATAAAASAASSDGAAAQAMIAKAFNAANAYPAGTYVVYTDGKLYRLTADHAANTTWANTSKVEVTAAAELDQLYVNSVDYFAVKRDLLENVGEYKEMDISSNIETDKMVYIDTNFNPPVLKTYTAQWAYNATLDVAEGDSFELDLYSTGSANALFYAFADKKGVILTSETFGVSSNTHITGKVITAPAGAAVLRFNYYGYKAMSLSKLRVKPVYSKTETDIVANDYFAVKRDLLENAGEFEAIDATSNIETDKLVYIDTNFNPPVLKTYTAQWAYNVTLDAVENDVFLLDVYSTGTETTLLYAFVDRNGGILASENFGVASDTHIVGKVITAPANAAALRFNYFGYRDMSVSKRRVKPMYSKAETDALVRGRLGALEAHAATLTGADEIALAPPNIKAGYTLSFRGRISSLNSLKLEYGYNKAYAHSYIVLDDQDLVIHNHRYTDEITTVQHGIDLDEEVSIDIKVYHDATADIVLTSESGQYKTSASWVACYGNVTVSVDGSLTDCHLRWSCDELKMDLWAFGDSYFDSWPLIAETLGFANFLIDGWSGRGSADALSSLQKSLLLYKPKKILWCLGMNDADSSSAVNATWKSTLDSLISVCEERQIELILCTIPNTPTVNNAFKNEIVRNSGYRYVDVCSAVGADVSTSWYPGLLGSDNVHPTNPKGRQVIAGRFMADVPEMAGNPDLRVIEREVSDLKTQVGDLSDLETTAKNTLVDAINDAAQSGVSDVQINGTSILQNGVANITKATDAQVKAGAETGKLLVPSVQDASAFFGLAKAAGDTTQSASDNAIGVYTDAAKGAIQRMLGVYNRGELIADVTATEDMTEIVVDTDLNGQPFELRKMFAVFSAGPSTTGAADSFYGQFKYINFDDVLSSTSFPSLQYTNATGAMLAKVELEVNPGMPMSVMAVIGSSEGNSRNASVMPKPFLAKALTYIRIYQSGAGKSLIPAGSNLKLYGIRIQ